MLDWLGTSIFVLPVLIIAYVLAGSAYAIWYRYPRFLKSNQDAIRESYDKFLKSKNLDENDQSYEAFLDDEAYLRYRPGKNLNSIFNWVLMWPWGLAWDLLHRPIVYTYNTMYAWIGSGLESVGKWQTRRILSASRPPAKK